jgi:hypothetical protein
MPGLRQIDNRQSAMPQRNPRFRIEPQALIVRPAMRDCSRHALERIRPE